MQKIYICENCKFLFEWVDKEERCPDCGSDRIRPSNEQEFKEFLRYREEFGKLS